MSSNTNTCNAEGLNDDDEEEYVYMLPGDAEPIRFEKASQYADLGFEMASKYAERDVEALHKSGHKSVTMKFDIQEMKEELDAVEKMIEGIMRSGGEERYRVWQKEERKFAEYLKLGQPFGLNTPKMDYLIDLMNVGKPYILVLLMKTWGGVWDLKYSNEKYVKEINSLKEEVFTYMKDPDSPIQKQYIKNVGKDILQEYGKLKGIEKILVAEVEKRDTLEREVTHHKGVIKQYEQLNDATAKTTVASMNPETGKIESYETTLKKQIEYNCAMKEQVDNYTKLLAKAEGALQKQEKIKHSLISSMKSMKERIEKFEGENKRLKAALKKYQEEKKALSTEQINKSEIVKVLKKSITELTSSLATRTKQYEDYKRKMKKSRRK